MADVSPTTLPSVGNTAQQIQQLDQSQLQANQMQIELLKRQADNLGFTLLMEAGRKMLKDLDDYVKKATM